MRKTKGKRPRRAALACLDEDKEQQTPRFLEVSHHDFQCWFCCLLSFSVSICDVTWKCSCAFSVPVQ